MQLHWDGNNTKVSERNRSAAFGTGATPPILDRASLAAHGGLARDRRAAGLRRRLPRPVRPRPRGARAPPIYARDCAACHGASGRDFTGEYVGKVTPDRRGRHRPRPPRQLHPRPRGEPERALRRLRRRALPDLPQDRRLRQRPARRPLAARPLPAQRLGPDPRRAALAAGRAPRAPSCAATTSTTRRRWASSATPPASTRRVQPRLFCYVTPAGAAADCPAGAPPMNGTCAAGPCRGNGNGGHLWGTALPRRRSAR